MLSVIVPVFNEADSLSQLAEELDAVARSEGYDMQVILVDDGSTDASWPVICRLAAENPRILGIRLRRNFGKAAALRAGFDAAEGDRIVTLDADLQDDPAEIASLMAKLDEGYDVVNGWKRVRHDPDHRVRLSKMFNWLVRWMTGVPLHDHNCGLKCFRREVMLEIRLYGELHRFVPVLAAAKGFRVTEVVVQHRPRKYGQSKYGLSRVVKAFLDLLTVKFLIGYGHRPQHVLGTIGLASFLLGALGMIWLAVRWCFSRIIPGMEAVHLHETAALYYSLAFFIIGGQFLSLGLLGEMLAAFLIRDSDTYSIAEHTSPAGSSTPSPSATTSQKP